MIRSKEKISIAVSIILITLFTSCNKKELLYVDGQAVSASEMDLLDGDKNRAVRMKLIQKMAEEEGLAEPFSFDKLMKQMEEENQIRSEKKADGEIVFGIVEYTPLQYYNVTMGAYERLLKNKRIEQAEEEELRDFYENHKKSYEQIGAVIAEVTVWEGDQVLGAEEIQADAQTIRGISERDEALASYLINLKEGGTGEWEDKFGRRCVVYIVKKADNYCEPYENVAGAVSEQYAAQKLEEELTQRMENCTVQDFRADAERRFK